MKRILFALAAFALAIPALALLPFADPNTLEATGTFTLTGPDGTPATYTIRVPWATIYDVGYQWTQAQRNANQRMDAGKDPVPSCLVDPSGLDSPPVNTRETLDWNTYRLRVPQDGSVLYVVPATGAVYRDGLRQGNATVSKLCVFGASIFGKGKTSGTWFKWVGVSASVPSGWTTVPADRDAAVLE